MAGNRIKGITIEIGGDTTELSKSLKGVNGQLKDTQSQLNDVNKLLKLDPSNTELLAQKQELLSKKVVETSDKLKQLKDAEQQLKDAGVDENSEQFQGLRREIIDTELSLKSATEQSKSFNATLTKISETAKDVSSKADAVANATKGMATAAAGVITGLAGAAYKASTYSDDLNTLAKQSGLATSEIQKFQYASDLIDVSTDSIVSALKKMRKNMDSTSKDVQEAWKTIGVATTDAEGNFRNSTEVFYDVLDGLSKIENETERDIVSMQLFGKGADDLAGIIDDGGEALRNLGAEAESLGLILSQDTLDSMNAVNDQIDTMKARAQALFYETGAKALETLTPVFDVIIEKLSKVFEYIGNLDADKIENVLKISSLIVSIYGVATAISKVSKTIDALAASKSVAKMVNFFKSNPWVIIIAGVVAVTTAIIKNWDTVSEFLTRAWENIKIALHNVRAWIHNNFIMPVGNFFIDMINGVIDAINVIIRGLNKISIKVPNWKKVFGDLAGKSWGINIGEIGHISSLESMDYQDYVTKTAVASSSNSAASASTTSDALSSYTPSSGNDISTTVNVNFEGNLAQLGRILSPVIDAESQRVGKSLVY